MSKKMTGPVLLVVGVGFLLLCALLGLVGTTIGSTESDPLPSAGGCAITGDRDEAKWQAAFQEAGVFQQKAAVFLELAEEQEIDPVLFASIAMSETAWGSSAAVVNKRNPGGLMQPGGGGLMAFPTLEEGLSAMALTLHNRIVKDGLNTIEKLGAVYAPVGATNDPTNLNANWIPTVYSIAEKFGGLTMNCDAQAADVKVVGDKISYYDAVLREAQKYEGWPYTWGGSHPESGFDCSGLTQWAFHTAGVALPRTATAQYDATTRIGVNEVKAGDLIFFKGTYGGPDHISHVGIVVNATTMYDSDSAGIGYHQFATGYWKQHFAGFGRVKP